MAWAPAALAQGAARAGATFSPRSMDDKQQSCMMQPDRDQSLFEA
jgi:hypothetical protein